MQRRRTAKTAPQPRAGSFDANAVGQPLAAHVEQELPAPRHVEQPSLGTESPVAHGLQAGRVIHAVPVLGHMRIQLDAPGNWRALLRAGPEFEYERSAA